MVPSWADGDQMMPGGDRVMAQLGLDVYKRQVSTVPIPRLRWPIDRVRTGPSRFAHPFIQPMMRDDKR